MRGLSVEDVKALLDASPRGASDDSTYVAAEVRDRTEGNPLFISEVLRLLEEEGAISVDKSASPSLPRMKIPEGVFEAIGRRLNRLREGCQAVLTRVAVIGRGFGLNVSSIALYLSPLLVVFANMRIFYSQTNL